MSAEVAPNWPVVGTDFLARRDRLNLTQEQLAEEADLNRDTISAVENGKGSAHSRRKVAEALTRLEEEGGTLPPIAPAPEPESSQEPHMIEFEVSGDFGVRVVVKGPIENAADLEASVARLIRDMKRDAPPKG